MVLELLHLFLVFGLLFEMLLGLPVPFENPAMMEGVGADNNFQLSWDSHRVILKSN